MEGSTGKYASFGLTSAAIALTALKFSRRGKVMAVVAAIGVGVIVSIATRGLREGSA